MLRIRQAPLSAARRLAVLATAVAIALAGCAQGSDTASDDPGVTPTETSSSDGPPTETDETDETEEGRAGELPSTGAPLPVTAIAGAALLAMAWGVRSRTRTTSGSATTRTG